MTQTNRAVPITFPNTLPYDVDCSLPQDGSLRITSGGLSYVVNIDLFVFN